MRSPQPSIFLSSLPRYSSPAAPPLPMVQLWEYPRALWLPCVAPRGTPLSLPSPMARITMRQETTCLTSLSAAML